MAAQVGEDKVMAAQAEDSQATPEDKTIAEQSADAPDLSITQTHQSYVPSHRQV